MYQYIFCNKFVISFFHFQTLFKTFVRLHHLHFYRNSKVKRLSKTESDHIVDDLDDCDYNVPGCYNRHGISI